MSQWGDIMVDTMEIRYTPEALAKLGAFLAADPAISRAVNNELDLFEADPSLTRWRKRVYSGVAARSFGFDVHAPSGDALVLWQQTTASNITVVYVGEPI